VNERLESNQFPYLPIRIEVRGRIHELQALVDTGFNGDVTVPPSVIGTAESPDWQLHGILADGSRLALPAYHAEVRLGLHGPFQVSLVALGDEPTVGPRVTDRFLLILDHGRRVILEP